jgi:dTDP-4-dehydrorhamnose 3,5-epimerase
LVEIESEVHRDDRGFFLETYHRRRYRELGIDEEFVQDNHSRSKKGVLRGVHYQEMSAPMGKLVRCTTGAILDVAVDLRVGSPTFGEWYAVELSGTNWRQLFVPVGFGHAFLVLSDVADVEYKCTGYYKKSAEGVIAWNDPRIGIEWPEKRPLLSDRDSQGMSLEAYLRHPVFTYAPTPTLPRGRGRESRA